MDRPSEEDYQRLILMKHKKSPSWFSRFAKWTASAAGKPVTFGLALLTIVVWGVTGPVFHYSDTWQLIINTGTTIVTFLMVFLIQNTQNRDSQAMHAKLDELILAVKDARNVLIDSEDMDEDELKSIREKAIKESEQADAKSEETDSAKEKPKAKKK